jgi:hypothetical protein
MAAPHIRPRMREFAARDFEQSERAMKERRITTNGNQLVSYHTETRLTDGGIFYPITASTEMGELYQQSFAEGKLNVFGRQKIAIETEGEHAAQGGAIAFSVTGRRTVNFTSGQGIVYAIEQYYHAPGTRSTFTAAMTTSTPRWMWAGSCFSAKTPSRPPTRPSSFAR